jgi:hypothetical protein
MATDNIWMFRVRQQPFVLVLTLQERYFVWLADDALVAA